jgi:hypothetical protein
MSFTRAGAKFPVVEFSQIGQTGVQPRLTRNNTHSAARRTDLLHWKSAREVAGLARPSRGIDHKIQAVREWMR